MNVKKIVAIAACAILPGVAFAGVEIKGNNEQTVTIKNGAIANVAVGALSKAKLSAASVEGNATLNNSKQLVTVTNGALANVAVGATSTAELNVATVNGK